MLEKIQLHSNDYRNLLNLMGQNGFEEYYNANKEEAESYIFLIRFSDDLVSRRDNFEALRLRFRNHCRIEESLRELRIEAAQLGIVKYSRFDKAALISAIQAIRKAHAEGNFGLDNGGKADSKSGGNQSDGNSLPDEKTGTCHSRAS